MAQESCNLDKEDAEILKSSSPSNPSPSQSTTSAISNPLSAAAAAAGGGGAAIATATAAAPASLCLKPQEFSAQKAERPEASVEASFTMTTKKKSRLPVEFGNRCTNCKRKVGLTGFRCRCGDLFCSRHRYSETHDCSFDYKALGREEISKANPVIRAAKIIKI